MLPRWFPIAVALLALGCEREPDAALRAAESARAPGELLQDLRDDGTRMFAVVQPVPPHSDAPRALVARWLDERGARAWSYDGVPLLDARFVPRSESAVVITTGRELALLESSRALPTHLDAQVHAPLSLSADGRFVAYARGEIPDLEIVRYDLARRAEVSCTHGMAPAWSPALSEDGAAVLFVSGASGSAELYAWRGDGRTVQLSERKRYPLPFPTGPSAPVWSGGTLAFEDHEGVHLLSLEPLRVVRSIPGVLPVAARAGRALLVQEPGGGALRQVSLEAGEVAR